jgi:hypothetical protein
MTFEPFAFSSLPVYLLHPKLFVSQTSKKSAPHKLFQVQDWEGVKAKYLEILTSRNQVMSKVFKGFPDLQELYALNTEDYWKHVRKVVVKWGRASLFY